MRERAYYQKLEEISKRMIKWAANQEPILVSLNREVQELKTPESKLLYEAEKDAEYQRNRDVEDQT